MVSPVEMSLDIGCTKNAFNDYAQVVRSVCVHWYSQPFLVYTDVETEASAGADSSLSLSFRRVLMGAFRQ